MERRIHDRTTRGDRSRLAEKEVGKLPAPERGNRVYYDSEVTGFGFCVTANGARSFVLRYVFDGRERRATIGQWPVWSVVAAREHAKAIRRRIDQGIDPLVEKEARRAAPTFEEIAEQYLARHAAKKKSGRNDVEYLKRDVIPRWGKLKAAGIKRRDVIALIEEKAETAPVAANRLLACVRKLFNWAVQVDLLETTPCVQVRRPTKEKQRDRVLTQEEIQTFWHKLESPQDSAPVERRRQKAKQQPARLEMAPEVRAALRLILVTAQRPGEVAGMAWGEIDGEWWTLPSERSKNGLAHRIPLTKTALEIIGERTQARHVFSLRRGKPLHRGALATALRRNLDYLGLAQFTPHDLRRTAASLMTGAGVSRLVVSKILNHAEPGVTAIYDRHGYDAEKKQALETWEKELLRMMGRSKKADVVEIRR